MSYFGDKPIKFTCRVLRIFFVFYFLFLPNLSAAQDSDSDGVSDSQETIDGTNSSDPDSLLEHSEDSYCVEWNGFLSNLTQIIELRNAGCSTLDLEITLRGLDGTTRSTLSISLPPSQQLDVVANALSGFQANDYGNVCARITGGDNDTLDMMLVAYKLNSSSFDFAFSTPSIPARTGNQSVPYNNFFPTRNSLQNGFAVASYLQISNEENSSTGGDVVYRNQAGTEVSRIAVGIPAYGRIDVPGHVTGANTVGTIEWQPTNMGDHFRLVLNRYFFNGTTATAPVLAAVSLPAKRASGAASGSPFNTGSRRIAVLELNNTLNSSVTVNLDIQLTSGFIGGTPPASIVLAPKATWHVILNAYVPSGIGIVYFDPATAQSVVANVIEYNYDQFAHLQSINLAGAGAAFGPIQKASYNTFLGACQLRLANLDSTDRSVDLTMKRYDGTSITLATPVSVPAEKVVEVNICSADPQLAYGEVTLTPSVTEAITGELIRFSADNAQVNTALRPRSDCSSTTTLTSSVSQLALSVNDVGLSAALTGTPRLISITNTGAQVALNVTYNVSPALPSGTTISSSTCGNIAPSATCQLTITPGATASAAPGDLSPVPSTLTISGSNTNTITPDISVLTYGSVYQSGYVFSVDDTTPQSGSVGGKVAALTDQSAGIFWASDGNGSFSFDNIPGILDTSTSPPCNGRTDGACNTNEIVDFYPSISLSSYAAGLCRATIGGYSDWYLPSACELGYDTSAGNGCGTVGAPTIQNMASNLIDNGGIGGLAGKIYWSSTENSASPTVFAWSFFFDTGGGSFVVLSGKANTRATRCARSIN